MTSYLRINHFVDSANRAYSAHHNYLVADSQGLGVTFRSLPEAFSIEGRDLNKRTWKVFRESLVGTIGQDKFNWICTRYRSKINFTKLEQTGAPLLPEHVELFSVGSSQLRIRDIKSRFPADLNTLTRAQLSEKIRRVQPFSVVGGYIDPVRIHGTPKKFSAWFVHNKALMDKEKQLLFSNTEGISFQSWLERMVKATSCRELMAGDELYAEGGQIIPVSGRDGLLDYYQVYRKVATGHGLVAYALKPITADTSLKPMIIFRPSQFAIANEDAVETYLNDVQAHVGEMGWEAAISNFERLMNDTNFRPNNEKVEIAGYSLGGAHAQYFLAAHHANVSHATFYSDPSLAEEIAERFSAEINQMPRRSEPLNIQIFRMKGDFCQYVGGKHVGWGVTHPDVNIQLAVIDHENRRITASRLHAHRIFDNTTFPYAMENVEDPQELFNQLDNSRRGPEIFWYEKTRRVWGQAAFYGFRAFAGLVHMVSWMLGIKILRSSRDVELT